MSLFLNRNVDYFLKIVSSGSFKEASRLLNLSQPALSITIKNFESEIGCSLFTREKKDASLTPQGRKLYEKLSEIQKKVALETSSVLNQNFPRRYRLGCIPWFAQVHLLPLMKRINPIAAHEAQYFFRPSGLLYSAVESGRLDFAFINSPKKPAGVAFHELMEDTAFIGGLKSKFAHIEKATSYLDLEKEPWIYGESRGRDWTESIPWDQNGFVVSDIYSVRFLMLEGYGIYEVQKAYFTKHELSKLAVAKFSTRFSENKIYAIWRKDIKDEAKSLLESVIAKI